MISAKMTVQIVKAIAEVGNWDLTDERTEEIAEIFQPLYDDTCSLRQMELRDSVPETLLKTD